MVKEWFDGWNLKLDIWLLDSHDTDYCFSRKLFTFESLLNLEWGGGGGGGADFLKVEGEIL